MIHAEGMGVTDELLAAYLDPAAQEMQHIGSYELPSVTEVERVIAGVEA